MAATGGPTTDLERYLETADVILRATHAMGGGGHPNSFLGVLVGGVGVLVKPSDSTADAAKMIRREVAAWRLAAALGWPDLVAATVLREVESLQTGDRIEASAQVIWPSTQPGVAVDSFSDDDIWRAAVLDALIRQTDRNPTNWLAVPQDPSHGLQRLKLIDHGYAPDTWTRPERLPVRRTRSPTGDPRLLPRSDRGARRARRRRSRPTRGGRIRSVCGEDRKAAGRRSRHLALKLRLKG